MTEASALVAANAWPISRIWLYRCPKTRPQVARPIQQDYRRMTSSRRSGACYIHANPASQAQDSEAVMAFAAVKESLPLRIPGVESTSIIVVLEQEIWLSQSRVFAAHTQFQVMLCQGHWNCSDKTMSSYCYMRSKNGPSSITGNAAMALSCASLSPAACLRHFISDTVPSLRCWGR
jgi:hypothetical protein